MRIPETQSKSYQAIKADIESGEIKIPQFQRNFVWDKKTAANLMDSIIKGYPIGSFIIWKTRERMRSIKNIGNRELPEPPEGDFIKLVLDGQQRLTTIYASLEGLEIMKNNKKTEDYSEIYVDLAAKEDEPIVITDITNRSDEDIIKITDLLNQDLIIYKKYPEKYYEKIEDYKNRIKLYTYSVIEIQESPLDIASEIFSRINTSGKNLTLFEIMVAKTFDAEKEFDLYEKFNNLIDRLREINYETIADASVLQTVSIILTGECKRKTILNIKKEDFINMWNDSIESIEHALEYFRNVYRIPVSRLLPYNALIVPFAYFFYKNNNEKPTGDKQKYMEDFFWRCALSNRYSSSAETKIAQDIKRIDKILNNEIPKYEWPIDSSPEYIKLNGVFNTGSSYTKAILCIYSYHQPKSFNDDSLVNISNDWLKIANSKNYHHFFPKAYLKKKGVSEDDINNILNITIVDDFLNKREIRVQSPAEYMKKFKKQNEILLKTMNSHLIGDLEKFGIWKNDYEEFIKERGKLVSKEIKKRIIPQETDKLSRQEIFESSEDLDFENMNGYKEKNK